MLGYHLLFGFLLVFGSLALIAMPRQVWLITHGWRFANPQAVELSGAQVAWTRLSGAVGIVMGVGLIVYGLH
jgi:NhaP-type Na+/H+ and K+/H+ antiporter